MNAFNKFLFNFKSLFSRALRLQKKHRNLSRQAIVIINDNYCTTEDYFEYFKFLSTAMAKYDKIKEISNDKEKLSYYDIAIVNSEAIPFVNKDFNSLRTYFSTKFPLEFKPYSIETAFDIALKLLKKHEKMFKTLNIPYKKSKIILNVHSLIMESNKDFYKTVDDRCQNGEFEFEIYKYSNSDTFDFLYEYKNFKVFDSKTLKSYQLLYRYEPEKEVIDDTEKAVKKIMTFDEKNQDLKEIALSLIDDPDKREYLANLNNNDSNDSRETEDTNDNNNKDDFELI